MKRKISLFIGITILSSMIIHQSIFAATKNIYTPSADMYSLDQYNLIKDQLPINTPHKNPVNGLYFNTVIWRDKGIVVYGDYTSLPADANDFKEGTQISAGNINPNSGYYIKGSRRGEYRFHGYDLTGSKYTNINFINDNKAQRPLDSKQWLYVPWDNDLTPSKTKPQKISDYNEAATRKSDPLTQQWINSAIQGWNVKYGLLSDGSSAADLNTYNYVHVRTAPGILNNGEGTMWHRTSNGKVWYQTMSIPRVTGKQPVPVTAQVELLSGSELDFVENAPSEQDNVIKRIKARVTGTLNDDAYYNSNVEKVTHYTRYDIDHFVIRLNGITAESGKVSKRQNNGWAEFEIKLTIGQIKALKDIGYKYLLKGEAVAVYGDGKYSNTGIGEAYATFNGRVIELKEEPLPSEPPPVVVEPKPNIAHPWYDIVPYPASDDTDMSTVKSREVYINGVLVNDNLFFSGSYVFGEGNHGINRIDIHYTSTDDYPSQVTRWIYIYDTKPRAQFQFAGNYKQNRKMVLQDTSNSANDDFVLGKYPINSYQWRFRTVDGDPDSLKMHEISSLCKELMYKKTGTYEIELVVTNTLGRVSDPYILTFEILEDTPPAVICNLNYNVLARNETIGAYMYEAVSTDGDIIAENKVEVYYDSNNDGTCEQLLATFENVIEFPNFTPTKLGNYKFVNTVKEEFGQDTLSEFITDEDKKVKVVEREFFVDNYIPMTGLYVDIPIVRPQIDTYIMMDKNLNSNKVSWILNNRMNINNNMRSYNIIPRVETWDMKTYTYSQPASTSSYTGTSYPSSTCYFSSNGYSGTLNRTSVSDNGSSYDYGHYETKTESKTATGTAPGWSTNIYTWWGSWYTTGGSESNTPSISYSDGEGFSGTLYKTGWTANGSSGSPPSNPKSGDTYTRTTYYTAYYSGTVTRTVQIWVPNWVWVSSYTGYYSGTIYKSVRQPYTDPFRDVYGNPRPTSFKYVVYVSDGNVAELSDLQMVMSKSDAKLILIGRESMKSQIAYEYFILNDRPIDQVVQDAVNYIAEHNEAIERYYVLAGQGNFTMNTADYDEENDLIIEKKYQYVQNPNYYDNSTGMESFAAAAFSEDVNWIDIKADRFNTTGEFRILRRIKDQPSTDPVFADFSKYSGMPELRVYSHRKPIANATLDWDYDSAKGVYATTWRDMSFDLDHSVSRVDKGIIERKIMFRKNSGEWLYYIPDELAPGTYELQYYVRDVENTWSDPFVLNFTLSPAPPIQFNAKLRAFGSLFSLSGIPASEYLEVYDAWTRYPYNMKMEMAIYNGSTRVTPLKTVYYDSSTGIKNGNDINWNNISYQIPATLVDGTYTFKLSAVDVNNASIRKDIAFPVTVSTPVNLLPDMPSQVMADEVCDDIGAITSKYAGSAQVTLFSGTGWQTTFSMTAISESNIKNWFTSCNIPADIPDGTYLAVFRASTPNGNSEIRPVSFSVESLKITGVTIQGYWNHWRGQVDIFGRQITNEPHRFLSLEKVKVDVYTTGYADKVVISFSPELEAMQFTDEYGNIYDYKNDFDLEYVDFPKEITLDDRQKDNHAHWEYTLPLANSTKDWNDEVKRTPYCMTVTVFKGGKSAVFNINDIEITGNIYDLVYVQPVN